MKVNNDVGLSKVEFKCLLLKLQIKTAKHRINEIYSYAKEEGNNLNSELNFSQLKSGLEYIKNKNKKTGLVYLKKSESEMIVSMMEISLELLLLLPFILFGMNAFSVVHDLSWVITGIFPIVGGLLFNT